MLVGHGSTRVSRIEYMGSMHGAIKLVGKKVMNEIEYR